MSRMIDRNKRDMQPLEGAGAGGGMRSSGRSSVKSSMDTKVLDGSLVGLSAAKAAGAAGMAVGQQERRAKAASRDMAITRTENMQRSAAKLRMDESVRHYKGTPNATKQK
jgi:hypothetical protein